MTRWRAWLIAVVCSVLPTIAFGALIVAVPAHLAPNVKWIFPV